MTLLVRDEEDVVEDNIRYHLAQGVDFVVVTDNLSTDRTPEILERLERGGRVKVLRERRDDYSQAVWVTRMARMAHVVYDADWVINNDADEFWWPKEGNLKTTLSLIPPTSGVVTAQRVNFLPLTDGEGSPLDRMIFREVLSLNPIGEPLQPKVCHRGRPDVEVAQGNHSVRGTGLSLAENQEPIVIFHYPMRSYAHFENKIVKGGMAYQRNHDLPEGIGETWRKLYQDHREGRLPDYYRDHVLSDAQIAEGMKSGQLVRDSRLAEYLCRRLPDRRSPDTS